jgi:LuxR family maltose regulon positive regulatory protein
LTHLRQETQQVALLETKLHPPPTRPQAVARERLLEPLRPEPGQKLVLVAAPAGSGKTTLLGMWRDIEVAQRPVGWVTLDEGDDDPVVLWSYVIEALRRSSVPVDLSATPARVGPENILGVVLPQIVNRLAEHGDAALVLDDFHRLSAGPARDGVAWLVEHAPATFQLVLATRSEPALPLGALRAYGQLAEVRAEQLRFTPVEADAFINGRLELALDSTQVADLVERTEGWAAGLYLAALSLRGVEDRDAFLSRFGGANRYVVDFLVDTVLDAHDPETQELMLRSSILERLSGRLCDAVLEREGSGQLLAALARTNLFLVPLDDRGEWYRFHHLFAQLLRAELEHREPGLAATLHRRALAWHRNHGSLDEAIEHALQAGAFADAADMLAAAWMHYLTACRFTTLLGWFERFPAEVLGEDQRLLLAQAWTLSVTGAREAAGEAIAAVERLGGLDAGPLPDGFGSLEANLATLRALVPWGDIGMGLRESRRAAALEGPDSTFWPVICFVLGRCHYLYGEPDVAEEWFVKVGEVALAAERWAPFVGMALAYRSFIAGDAGRLDEQELRADESAALARDRGLEEVVGEAFVASGRSLAARGRHQEALRFVERGLGAARSLSHPLDVVYALLAKAEALRALGDRESAAAAIAEARTIADGCADPGILRDRLDAFEEAPPARPRPSAAELSVRELVVLRMLGGSLSERDIGRELYLSHNTVHTHTRSIYRKLGVSSRRDALDRARTLGLL